MNPASAIPAQNSTYTPYVPYGQAANTAIDSAQQTVSQPQQQSVQPPASKGNWFTHLLPTIGSIGAPLLATALAPETGGLSLLGLLAAGGGSAAGKALENTVEGSPTTASGLATSGLEGVGGQLMGGVAGKVLGGIGGKVAGTLDNAVTGRAAQTATDAASQDAANEATRIGNEFAAVKPGQGQVGPAVDIAKQLGIANPTAKDLTNIGSIHTGSNPETGTGVLNYYKQQALNQAGGKVDLSNTLTNLESNLAKPENSGVLGSAEPVSSARGQLPKVPSNPATKIIQQVRNMLPGDTTEGGQIATTISPQDGTKLLKDIGNQINSTTPKPNSLGVLDQGQVAENNIWKSVYNDVRDSVYNRPEVDKAVSGLKVGPDEEAVIDDAIRSNGITDPAVATKIKSGLIDTLNNSQTGNDLLTAERPFVNVSKVGTIAQKDMINNPQLPRNVRANKAAALPSEMPANNSGALLDTAAIAGAPMTHGLSLVGALPHAIKAAKSPATQAIANNLIKSGVSKKIASAIPGVATGAAQFITHSPDMTANPVNLNLGNNTMNPGATNDPNSMNSLLLQLAVANAANPSTQGSGTALLNQILPQIQNSNVAQNSLTGAENAFQQAGGGQGGIMGNLSKVLGGITGNPASQYEQQRQQLISQLNPLGIPTSAVPDITGNNQSAQNQFQTLQQMINARLNGGSFSAIPSGY